MGLSHDNGSFQSLFFRRAYSDGYFILFRAEFFIIPIRIPPDCLLDPLFGSRRPNKTQRHPLIRSTFLLGGELSCVGHNCIVFCFFQALRLRAVTYRLLFTLRVVPCVASVVPFMLLAFQEGETFCARSSTSSSHAPGKLDGKLWPALEGAASGPMVPFLAVPAVR
jgi:hypothetical protein